MNKFSLPASPNWYETAIVSCSSDNELFYGSNGDIVMIKPQDKHEVADIKTICNAHDRITALSVNVHWGSPEKLLVTIGEDKFVRLWDMKTFELRNSHNTHKENKSKLVGATFPSDDRIISVSSDGLVVLWRPAANEISTFTHFFTQKVQITAVSCCPHATWLAAFGLAKGQIIVADLRKSGKVLYNLRGHESNILSLVWCPTPYNIFPEQKRTFLTPRRNNVEITRSKPNSTPEKDNKTEETVKTSQETVQSSQEIDKICQKIDKNSQEIDQINQTETIKEKIESLEISSSKPNIEKENNKQAANLVCAVKREPKVGNGKPIKVNPWVNLKHADDEDFVEEKPDPRAKNLANIDDNDFLSECLALKYRILNENEEGSEDDCKDKSECFSEENIIIEEKPEEKPIENVTSDCKELKDITESIKDKSDCKKTDNTDEIEKVTDNTEEIEKITDNMTALTTSETKLTTENGNSNKSDVVVPRKEFLLASAGKGSSIMIWRAGTDGRIQLELRFPVSKSSYNRNKFQRETKNWIALSWIRPNILLSSSPKGELLQWDLLKYEGNGRHHNCKLIHHDHKQMMFAMGAVVPLFPIHSTEWPTEGMNVWSFAQDRQIHRTTLDAKRDTLSSYPTFGGTVHSMANSTIDPNRIAFGIGESHIKLWNVSKAHLQVVGMTSYSPKNMGRITNLAWHPACEATLAFATSDGKIGLIDVNATSKAPTMFNTFFKGAVHKIEWGPLKGEPDEYALYACGDGKLVYFEKDTPTKVPVQINLEHENNISHMAWQPYQSHLTTPTEQLLAVATKDAVSITLFNSQLLVLRILYLQEKTICAMQWHPSKSEEEEEEDCSQWLAVVTNGHSVVVLELRGDTRGGMMVDNDEESCSKEIIANLKGHTRPVQGICWSPYDNGKLISVSDDSLAIIWDVKSGNMLSTYISGYADPIYSVLWSPINEDLIITVGRGSLNIWSIKEHPAKLLTDLDSEIKELTKQKNQYITRINEKATADLANISISNASEGTKPKTKTSRDKLLSVVSRFQGTSEYTLEDCRKMIQLQENEAKNIDPKEKCSTSTVLQLFGEREGVIKLLNMQQKQHTQRGKHEFAQHLSLWKGDLSETIKKAIENKTMTPWLISLAPMVSPTLWQLACRSFADQSSENDADCDVIQIAGYYLAGGGDDSLDMAVKALCNGALYREALALVKCRRVAEIHEGDGDNADNDKMVNTVLSQWASNALTKGSFEIAAQCFIALKNYDEAAKVLFKRSDLEAIKLSLELAKKGTNLDLISAVQSRFDMFKGETNITLEKPAPLLEKRTEIVDEKKTENVEEKKTGNLEENSDITEETV